MLIVISEYSATFFKIGFVICCVAIVFFFKGAKKAQTESYTLCCLCKFSNAFVTPLYYFMKKLTGRNNSRQSEYTAFSWKRQTLL